LLHPLSKYLLAGVLIVMLGGQVIILQSIAWAGMVVSYSRKAPLQEGIAKTFDGKHPCTLCNYVQKNSGPENEKQCSVNEIKLECFLCENVHDFSISLRHSNPGFFNSSTSEQFYSPPVPPPRLTA
jgi:hypothetical protein